jgi:CBS domain-containing protein
MRALSRMIVRNLAQLPVLDEKDRVVGVVTKGDIFYALFKQHFAKKRGKKSKKAQAAH